MFRLKLLAVIRPYYKNTKVYFVPPFSVLVMKPKDGKSFLAETCSLILTDYNVVLADCNIHLRLVS
jgi:hypothetical protein